MFLSFVSLVVPTWIYRGKLVEYCYVNAITMWHRFYERFVDCDSRARIVDVSSESGVVRYRIDGKKYYYFGDVNDLNSHYTTESLKDVVYGFGPTPMRELQHVFVSPDLPNVLKDKYSVDLTQKFKQFVGPKNNFHCDLSVNDTAFVSYIFRRTFVLCKKVLLRLRFDNKEVEILLKLDEPGRSLQLVSDAITA